MTPTDEQVERVARAIWAVSFRPDTDDNSWDGQGVSDETRDGVREEARAAIAAMGAALPPQGDGWQDIASAPRDGTLCLFFAPGRNKAKYIERAKRQMTVVDAFSPQWVNGKYQLPENPYTHWRPLPAPPAAELERTKGET
jgi:hypothetical protein